MDERTRLLDFTATLDDRSYHRLIRAGEQELCVRDMARVRPDHVLRDIGINDKAFAQSLFHDFYALPSLILASRLPGLIEAHRVFVPLWEGLKPEKVETNLAYIAMRYVGPLAWLMKAQTTTCHFFTAMTRISLQLDPEQAYASLSELSQVINESGRQAAQIDRNTNGDGVQMVSPDTVGLMLLDSAMHIERQMNEHIEAEQLSEDRISSFVDSSLVDYLLFLEAGKTGATPTTPRDILLNMLTEHEIVFDFPSVARPHHAAVETAATWLDSLDAVARNHDAA